MALSSYRTCNNNAPQNLSNDEFIALQNLSKKRLLCLKGNSVVILGNSLLIVDRQDDIKQINNFSYQKKFAMVNMNDDTLLNFAVNQEKHVGKVLEKLIESISMTEENKKSLKPVGSRPGVMYGSCTVHLTNEFTVKDSFHFTEELLTNNLISLRVVWMYICYLLTYV